MFKILLLLVEDNTGVVNVVKAALRQVPDIIYHVDVAASLVSAIDALMKKHYDIILLDLTLPDSITPESCFDVIYETCDDIPIVVLTGLHDEALGIALIKRGAQDFLVKNEIGTIRTLSSRLRISIERAKRMAELKNSIESLTSVSCAYTAVCDRAKLDNGTNGNR